MPFKAHENQLKIREALKFPYFIIICSYVVSSKRMSAVFVQWHDVQTTNQTYYTIKPNNCCHIFFGCLSFFPFLRRLLLLTFVYSFLITCKQASKQRHNYRIHKLFLLAYFTVSLWIFHCLY